MSAPELYDNIFYDDLFDMAQFPQFYTTAAQRQPNIFGASVTFNLLFQVTLKSDFLGKKPWYISAKLLCVSTGCREGQQGVSYLPYLSGR